MAKYREKPVEVEAWQWNGITAIDALSDWVGAAGAYLTPEREFVIPTLAGPMYAAPGDWIIKDAKGKVFPCKPHVFAATYDPVPDL